METAAALALALSLLAMLVDSSSAQGYSPFYDVCNVTFGDSLVDTYWDSSSSNVVDLGLTENQGGSGFMSTARYLFGYISMKIKLVGGDSQGTVTSYYLASVGTHWCELDFEFLGNTSGDPYILQTNVFAEGVGEREQRIYLDFDPTTDYHSYGILWNKKMLLFLVDGKVIRVFHNRKADLGLPYLDYQPMSIYSSIWDGSTWATCGGGRKTDWSKAPFRASYKDFDIQACAVYSDAKWETDNCYGQESALWYGNQYWQELHQDQIDQLKNVQYNHLIYDYCTDLQRWNGVTPQECGWNWPQSIYYKSS